MRVGFFSVFRRDPQHYLLAAKMIASVRATMPGVEIVHLTDESSAPVAGVDEVRRKPDGKMLERRLEHYADLTAGDWLLVDTDVIVRRDVREDVFYTPYRDVDHEFDVALTDRDWPHLPQPSDVLQTMPFNTGVTFARDPYFWDEVLKHWRAAGDNDWLSEQRAVYAAVRTGEFRVKILPGMIYNYPPKSADDPCKGAAIVHYKGPRKEWMLR